MYPGRPRQRTSQNKQSVLLSRLRELPLMSNCEGTPSKSIPSCALSILFCYFVRCKSTSNDVTIRVPGFWSATNKALSAQYHFVDPHNPRAQAGIGQSTREWHSPVSRCVPIAQQSYVFSTQSDTTEPREQLATIADTTHQTKAYVFYKPITSTSRNREEGVYARRNAYTSPVLGAVSIEFRTSTMVADRRLRERSLT